MLLGLTGLVGYLTHLPLDIRHVAFSSANLGYSAVSGQFAYPFFLQCIAFVFADWFSEFNSQFFIDTLGRTALFKYGN